jgi:enoyl-CoA hydratase/carnithine racemase
MAAPPRSSTTKEIKSVHRQLREEEDMEGRTFTDINYQKDVQSGIVTLTLNRPERKNALDLYSFLELFWAAEQMGQDENAYAMIITGATVPGSTDPTREAFSSGGNFDPTAYGKLSAEIKAEIDTTDIAQKRFTLKMWELDKPVIAAVNGLAVGGGFTMCLACADLIYASEYAWAELPFTRLGIVPELASTYLLPRILGFQKAKEVLFLEERMPAWRLLELGLINGVLPHGDLLPYVREKARQLVPPKGAWQAVRMTKRAMHTPLVDALRKSLDAENEALNKAFGTTDFFEGLMARREKRPAVFTGR